VLATGLLPPSHWAYNGDVPRWPHDLARARALLDEAGYRPGPDGVRLRLTYKTSADAFRVAVAHVLAAQLAEVGIAVEVRPFEFATFFADIKKGDYQMATMQTTPITEPDFYYAYFHSSRIPDASDPDAQNRDRLRGEVPVGSGLRYVCAVAYVVPGEEPRLAEGYCEGRMAEAPRGEGGFGYDPLFLPADGDGTRTMAELSDEEKDRISHRGRAAREAAAWLAGE